MITYFSRNEDETKFLAKQVLERHLGHRKLILLYGNIGAGKTVFVKGMAKALGMAEKDVKSPTFSYVREYLGKGLTLVHIDLYRVRSKAEFDSLDILRYLEREDVLMVIEWAEHLTEIPPASLKIKFNFLESDGREITIFG